MMLERIKSKTFMNIYKIVSFLKPCMNKMFPFSMSMIYPSPTNNQGWEHHTLERILLINKNKLSNSNSKAKAFKTVTWS